MPWSQHKKCSQVLWMSRIQYSHAYCITLSQIRLVSHDYKSSIHGIYDYVILLSCVNYRVHTKSKDLHLLKTVIQLTSENHGKANHGNSFLTSNFEAEVQYKHILLIIVVKEITTHTTVWFNVL